MNRATFVESVDPDSLLLVVAYQQEAEHATVASKASSIPHAVGSGQLQVLASTRMALREVAIEFATDESF